MQESRSIDIVLPWVNGNDTLLNKERLSYMHNGKEAEFEDIAGHTRYLDLGEIRFCIASINIFAPFVRKIFIVTDRQNPELGQYLSDMFPDGYIPMEIIDHKDIFKGYEQFLPVFNSRAIEAMIWRIPDLSEQFILMNDDFMLTQKVSPEDFFVEDKTVCYADWFLTIWARLLRWMKPRKNGHKNVGFKDSMLNAVEVLGGYPFFLCLGHTPRALRKSFYEKFFSDREDVLIRNIQHKFRHKEQYNSQELFYMSEYRKGRCIQKSIRRNALYLKPKKASSYIDRKLQAFRNDTTHKFCCLNALISAKEEDRIKVLEWAEEKINQNLRKSL
ncbi:MAG: hypothetical protein E7124_00660 [Bacteroidales bacterium]|nr:hypothetical protein [Bacteroidales bacterium]